MLYIKLHCAIMSTNVRFIKTYPCNKVSTNLSNKDSSSKWQTYRKVKTQSYRALLVIITEGSQFPKQGFFNA